MEIFVEEIGTTPNSTASQLFIDGKPFCFVLEDGYREVKVYGETRIPAGRHQIKKRTVGRIFEQYKKKYGHAFVPELIGVAGFSDILIHIGNFVKDTLGCLLLNMWIGIGPDGNYQGQYSERAYLAFYTLISAAFDRGEEVWIEISRRDVIDENTPVG